MGALDAAVRAGKALYVGISSYSRRAHPGGGRDPARARHAAADPPAVVLDAQPLDRGGPARRAGGDGRRAASRSPRWPRACSPASTSTASRRARGRAQDASLSPDLLTEQTLAHVRALNEMAAGPGPVAGADGAGVGAARPPGHLGADRRQQRRRSSTTASPRCDDAAPSRADELDRIDQHAVDAGINLWARSSDS